MEYDTRRSPLLEVHGNGIADMIGGAAGPPSLPPISKQISAKTLANISWLMAIWFCQPEFRCLCFHPSGAFHLRRSIPVASEDENCRQLLRSPSICRDVPRSICGK